MVPGLTCVVKPGTICWDSLITYTPLGFLVKGVLHNVSCLQYGVVDLSRLYAFGKISQMYVQWITSRGNVPIDGCNGWLFQKSFY